MSKKIGFLIGSLREGSYTKMVANTIIELLPADIDGEIIEIENLQYYNEDLDGENGLKEWDDFRNKVNNMDGVIFVTPEYNRTFPAILKNAIDVGSRPYGNHSWSGRKVAVVSQSPGNTGGIMAHWDLKRPLEFLGAQVLNQPEICLSGSAESFDEEGKAVPKTKEFLQGFVDAFVKFIA